MSTLCIVFSSKVQVREYYLKIKIMLPISEHKICYNKIILTCLESGDILNKEDFGKIIQERQKLWEMKNLKNCLKHKD